MKAKLYFLLPIIGMMSMQAHAQEVQEPAQETAPAQIQTPAQNATELDQWSVGMRLGFVGSDLLYTSPAYRHYRHPLYGRGTIGFWAERELPYGLSIRPEFAFTGRGGMVRNDDIRYGLHMTAFDIRVALQYTFLRDRRVQPYVFLTPNMNFVMSGHITYKDGRGQNIDTKLTKGNVNPFNFSLMPGVGVRFPLAVDDFDFFVNAEIGYNIGCVNTFSRAERNGNVTPVNKIYSNVVGSRLSSNLEFAVSVGIPLSSINRKIHGNATETWAERRTRERNERLAAEEEQRRQQEELLKRLQQQQADNQSLYNEELAKYNANLSAQNRVGDGIKMYVVPSVALDTADDGSQEMNLKLEFAYETVVKEGPTLRYDKSTDDYPAGAYLPTQSKACKATLNFMKEQLDGELKDYFTPDTRVTIRITGETDGSAIKNKIPYKGEFGDFEDELIYLNGFIDEMTVTRKTGITSNGQLGFLRTQGVQKFIETYIDALQRTQNTYQIYAVERAEKGSQYRKISVELTVHNAYKTEVQQVTRVAQVQEPAAAPLTKSKSIFKTKKAAAEPVEPVMDTLPNVDINIPVTNRDNSDTYVLIVGNEKYKDIVGVVPFAENDARIFREYCIKTLGVPERQVRMELNATRNEISDGLDWLENLVRARQGKARIVVYYAGHGIPIGETTYLLPIDGNPEKPDQQIALNTLYGRLSDWNAASVTCIFDACFSGTRRNGQPIVQGGRGVAVKQKYDPVHGNLVIFSAAGASETAYPYPEQKHGLFTYWFLKALQESKGKMDYKSLIEYLTERVAVEASLMNRKQMPNLQYSESLKDTWFTWGF